MASGVLASPVGRRVALVGDTHANAVWTCRVVEELAADGVDMVVQLGDFGWWPRSDFALKVSEAAVGAGITVCFIDDNHEDHEHLGLHADLRSVERGRVDPVEMLPSLWYLPRGCAWQ
ncbi:MAG: metallophosphoesterase [Acidimicrobiia bacterium]|nr:metallophosphoesterase [Acidimicrobiia bacterium]